MKVLTYKLTTGKKSVKTTTYDEMSKERFHIIMAQQRAKTRHAPDNCDDYFVIIKCDHLCIELRNGEITNVEFIE